MTGPVTIFRWKNNPLLSANNRRTDEMALHYILDGYNIIKSDGSGAFFGKPLQAQREQLVGLINRNSPHGAHRNKITVVFDGTYENSFFGSRSVSGAVDIVFSSGDTADRLIEQIVLSQQNANNIIVVTDDRGIRKAVSASGAKIMETKEFLARLFNRSNTAAEPASAQTDNSEDEITDELSKQWLK